MAYTPTTWLAGQVLTASAINRIETALAAAASVADAAVPGYVSANALDMSVTPSVFGVGTFTHQAGAGWPTQYGIVVTQFVNINRGSQTLYAKETGQVWTRTANGASAWTDLRESVTSAHATNQSAFIKNAAGTITSLPYDSAGTPTTLAYRDTNGCLSVAGPTIASHAVNKSYVDTIAADLLSGARLSTAGRAIDNQDLNKILAPGWYSGANLVNGPGGTGYWFVTVLPHFGSTSWREQQAFQYGTGVTASTRQAMYRQNVSGTWSAWYPMGGGSGSVDTSQLVTLAAANPNQLYFRNSSGSAAGLSFGTAASASAIVQRQGNGHVTVPVAPAAAGDAASKVYVDQNVSWTGTANASESSQTRGSTVVRTNRSINPRAVGGTNWGNAGYGTNGVGAQTFPSTGGSLINWSTKPTGGGHSTTHVLTGRTLTANTVVTVSAEVACDVARQAFVRFANATVTDGPAFQLAAGWSQRIYATFTVSADVTAPVFEFRLPDVTGVGGFAVDKVLIEVSSDVGTYFDGNGSDVTTKASDVGAVPALIAGVGQVFGRSSSGLTGVSFTTAATAGTLAQRSTGGNLTVPTTPSATTDATSKAYVDTATADLNGRLGPIAKDMSGTDLNTMVTTGFFRGSAMVNSPNGTGWWYILIQSHDTGSWQLQTLVGYTGTGDGLTYQRQKKNGTWQAWTQIGDTAGVVLPSSVGNGQLFIKNSSGVVTGTSITTAASASVMVQRQGNGHIIVPGTPAAATDAASKGYVDAIPSVMGTFTGDLNTLATTGPYRTTANSTTNLPSAPNLVWYVEHREVSATSALQRAALPSNGLVFERYRMTNNTTTGWTGWWPADYNGIMSGVYSAIAQQRPTASLVADITNGSQAVASSTWTRVALNNLAVDTRGGYDTTNNWYTIPVDGTYQLTGTIRFPDGSYTGQDVAIGIGTTQGDNSVDTLWMVPGSKRASIHMNRLAWFPTGAQVRLYLYSENKAVTIKTASLGIHLVEQIVQEL